MYLGGMGGSGKSAVFNAIMDFFVARKEEYPGSRPC
jgi:ABC-type dipeptide/oligopeptide/nickel transport system ATPase component